MSKAELNTGVSGKITINHDKTLKRKNIPKEEYNKLKQKYLNSWRPIIFKRDNFHCQNCGSKNKLQLAHITACIDFVKKYGKDGIAKSFRQDNLLTVCELCHIYAQHAMLNGLDISDDAKHQGRNVFKLFEKKITERGWRKPTDLDKPIKKAENKKEEKKHNKISKKKKWCTCNNCKKLFRPGWGLQVGKNKFKCPACGQNSIVNYSFVTYGR